MYFSRSASNQTPIVILSQTTYRARERWGEGKKRNNKNKHFPPPLRDSSEVTVQQVDYIYIYWTAAAAAAAATATEEKWGGGRCTGATVSLCKHGNRGRESSASLKHRIDLFPKGRYVYILLIVMLWPPLAFIFIPFCFFFFFLPLSLSPVYTRQNNRRERVSSGYLSSFYSDDGYHCCGAQDASEYSSSFFLSFFSSSSSSRKSKRGRWYGATQSTSCWLGASLVLPYVFPAILSRVKLPLTQEKERERRGEMQPMITADRVLLLLLLLSRLLLLQVSSGPTTTW